VFRLHQPIRSALALVLMPAAVWSGIQAPECVCSTGEHRFFCPHMMAAAVRPTTAACSTSTASSCCSHYTRHSCCIATASLHDATCRDAGMQSATSAPPCSHCTAVPNSTPMVLDRVEAPSTDHVEWFTPSSADDQATLAALVADDRVVPESDRLPLTDRVIVLCCLLI
jgi:hypothetical protein